MTNYVWRFPDGATGLGLLLVRACYASVAFAIAATLPASAAWSHLGYLIAGLVALLLAMGFATRVAAVLLGVAVAAALPVSNPVQQLLLAGHLGGCAAIALLGPGAFSIDARRHGRRVIHLQANSPDRGTDD
jgi:putative oxidoreductase